jgi:hypothetical protein
MRKSGPDQAPPDSGLFLCGSDVDPTPPEDPEQRFLELLRDLRGIARGRHPAQAITALRRATWQIWPTAAAT